MGNRTRSHMDPPVDRIRRHYKSLKRSEFYRSHGIGWVWMTLARQYRMPIRDIKVIVGYASKPSRELARVIQLLNR